GGEVGCEGEGGGGGDGAGGLGAREPAHGLCQRGADRVVSQRVFGVTGWKNAGKTTLVERLVAEFVRRGWTVNTVKHAHHEADVDQPGRDSWRHRAAGAREVALVGGHRYAIMREQVEPTLAEVMARLTQVV